MPMTGRSFAIASSTRRTLLRRPTSIGMIAPGKSTELRSGRMGSVSGISTGCSPPALALVIDRNLARAIDDRQGDLPVMPGTISRLARRAATPTSGALALRRIRLEMPTHPAALFQDDRRLQPRPAVRSTESGRATGTCARGGHARVRGGDALAAPAVAELAVDRGGDHLGGSHRSARHRPRDHDRSVWGIG